MFCLLSRIIMGIKVPTGSQPHVCTLLFYHVGFGFIGIRETLSYEKLMRPQVHPCGQNLLFRERLKTKDKLHHSPTEVALQSSLYSDQPEGFALACPHRHTAQCTCIDL